MASAEEHVEDSSAHEDVSDGTPPSENDCKPRDRTSIVDSTEEFEIIDSTGEDDDDLSDLPLLESVDNEASAKTEPTEQPEGDADGEDKWLDILGNGLLKKKVLTPGKSPETRPRKGQDVAVRLKTSLEDGRVIEDYDSLTFTLGDGDVIQVI
ncbi:hypothetical protein GDO78_014854 [Eleutherodactylus coqui]|uniref:Peptidylprolyl isomerase n=1 Tax=Eleutherodactylus coqui TaxID=57060 RepID=A0A8J6EEE3_ELECQ|nr:hypothetical protein GDO78_014854 [Eleutherodactylus coqui]